VTELTSFGAFVDWGMPKELLVPFAEQTADMRVGQRYPIGLYLDDSGRFAGTMKVSEMLDRGGHDVEWEEDEWGEGEAWRNEPGIGLFVIVERAFVGLVPFTEPHSLSRGQAARFRVTNILRDGRIELSLRRHAHEELADDAKTILEALRRPNAPRIGDKSSPDEIRDAFGISKKAFKRAVGRLLKERAVAIDPDGMLALAPAK
jgi:predicted RNA-binding protein (virulence factor B family)